MLQLHYRLALLLFALVLPFAPSLISDIPKTPLLPALTLLIGICSATVPQIYKRPLSLQFLGALGLYLLLASFSRSLPTNGDGVYRSLWEAGTLLFLVYVARECSAAIERIEETLLDLTGVTQPVARPVDESADLIDGELRFSRRLELPLSLVVVEAPELELSRSREQTLRELMRNVVDAATLHRVAEAVESNVRRTDLLLEDRSHRRFFLLCRNTENAGTKVVEENIKRAIEKKTDCEIVCRTATFPDDALTFEDLVEKAYEPDRAREFPSGELRKLNRPQAHDPAGDSSTGSSTMPDRRSR